MGAFYARKKLRRLLGPTKIILYIRYMNNNSKKRKHLPGITVNPNLPDLSKDPYVLKKVEEARAFLAKHPIPEDLFTKSKSK
jgi:hypothetical protein